jgi:hypothetical protein
VRKGGFRSIVEPVRPVLSLVIIHSFLSLVPFSLQVWAEAIVPILSTLSFDGDELIGRATFP